MTSTPPQSVVATVSNSSKLTCAKRHQSADTSVSVSHPDTSTLFASACYPTPPPSPILEDSCLSLSPPPLSTTSSSSSIITVQLEDLDDLDVSDLEEGDYRLADDSSIKRNHDRCPVIPIPVLLNTSHELPQAATFRLRSPASLLALFAGARVLTLDSGQSIWDRMPYSAAAAAIHARRPATEEDTVESLVGGAKPDRKVNGLHWNMRQHKSNEHISSIFVHPPTPERGLQTPPQEDPSVTVKAEDHFSKTPSPRHSPATSPRLGTQILPVVQVPSPTTNSASNVPIPLQVLPEVRSPPRRTIAMAPDSLQLTNRRGRRPRLFGFTEIPDGSGSSAGSSRAGSRQTSPEKVSYSPLVSPSATPPAPGSGSDFIPRRHPVRAKSETSLHTVTGAMSTKKLEPISPKPETQSKSTSLSSIPRKRENGLKLDFTGIIPLSTPTELSNSVVSSPYSAKLIRKKSGEILKPALKYGGPLAANGTPLGGPRTDISPNSPSSARFESKSCPTTPSCPKYVHFDTQLERVKLFLHDQKPQVVSRSGSPSEHYTTSEGEEYPFPSTDDERDDRRVLQIKLPNFPTHHAPDEDLYLESLFLDDDRKTLRGIIMCRNLAFQKWVAVRFTLDFWQTTSEVTASFKDSVKGGKYDRFSFTIKMQDIISRIEEKTMFMAIRYTTDGREIWDSNGGQNYQVLFEKVRLNPVASVPKRSSVSIQPGMGKAVGGRTSQWSVTGGNADDRLADLRAKLSRLTADDMNFAPQLSPNRERNFAFAPIRRPLATSGSPSGSPARSFSALDAKATDLPSAGGALAARYDFGQALKTTRRPSPNLQKVELPEVQTGLLNYGGRANHGFAASEFYSPRFSPNKLPDSPLTSDLLFAPGIKSDSPQNADSPAVNSPLMVPNVQVQGPSPPLPEEPARTPTATAPRRPSLSRASTTPAIVMSPSPRDSPPSLDDPSGSDRDTPSESPKSPPDFSLPKWSPTSTSEKNDMSHASYSSFIEQFCWGGVASSPPDVPRRVHSTSSLDAYFADARMTPDASPGALTPRPMSYAGQGDVHMYGGKKGGSDTPSSTTSSYFTSYTSTPGREDMEAVEDSLRLERGSPRIIGMRMGDMSMGRMSPPVAC